MITEIPTAKEFHDAGVNLLYLAWDIAMDLLRGSDGKYTGAELDEAMLEEYWQKSQIALGNALSLIQQSMELGIKGRITAISPFILISTEHSKWPTIDASFSDFRTIDAVDLTKVHNAVSTAPLDDTFRAFFDDIRRQRNKLMHSVPKDTFEPGTLIISVLTAAETLYNEMPWPERCIQQESQSRVSIIDGGETERNRVMNDIELALKYLKPAQAKRFLGFDKRRRAYLCPNCYATANRDYADDFPLLAQLRTKERSETTLDCKVCGISSVVERRDCKADECKANVLDDEGMCLFCQHDNFIRPATPTV
ncbi:MAG: hypothetical protein Q8Q88_23975 [Phenylobacterium sp.]|uniref:hypothetical protein n=1 Tax=Phenylobacterium sp. TaxID=1871053 RepID=UPI002737509E|nr:hypothetical protein [Phenylobacterium sp.]MDP3750095.1 hypothetical protein [Phenylobacterium sp.]